MMTAFCKPLYTWQLVSFDKIYFNGLAKTKKRRSLPISSLAYPTFPLDLLLFENAALQILSLFFDSVYNFLFVFSRDPFFCCGLAKTSASDGKRLISTAAAMWP
jgi:hypothetical protein